MWQTCMAANNVPSHDTLILLNTDRCQAWSGMQRCPERKKRKRKTMLLGGVMKRILRWA